MEKDFKQFYESLKYDFASGEATLNDVHLRIQDYFDYEYTGFHFSVEIDMDLKAEELVKDWLKIYLDSIISDTYDEYDESDDDSIRQKLEFYEKLEEDIEN